MKSKLTFFSFLPFFLSAFHIAKLVYFRHHEIREKSHRDAQRMYHQLRPLQSSPSGTFTERPMPTLEQFTQPRAAPTPGSSPAFLSLPDFGGTYPTTSPAPSGLPNLPPPSAQRNTNRVSGFYGSDNLHNVILPHARATGGGGNTLDRVKAHSRKLSDTFRKTQLPSPADSVVCGQTTTSTKTTMMRDEEVEMRCLVSYADENENEEKIFDEEEEEEEKEGRKKKKMMMQRSIRDAKNSGDSFQPT